MTEKEPPFGRVDNFPTSPNVGEGNFARVPVEYAAVLSASAATLRVDVDFSREPDTAVFSYLDEFGVWRPLGIAQRLYFKLDLFIGCRFGLFCYATAQPGGHADFLDFHFEGPCGQIG